MVNILAYADDLVLLAPSWRALQQLLDKLQVTAGVTFTSSLSVTLHVQSVHSGLCTNSVRTACPAQAWVVRRLTA